MSRFLIIRRMCPYCRQMVKVVNKINMRLPIEKKIKIIDAWEWEEFGLKTLPIVRKLEKDGLSEGFPFMICDGVIIERGPTAEQLQIALENFLENDFIY